MRNAEHYMDPTAGKAIEKADRSDKKKDADTLKMESALAISRLAFQLAGFEITERIVLRNVRTGKIYR